MVPPSRSKLDDYSPRPRPTTLLKSESAFPLVAETSFDWGDWSLMVELGELEDRIECFGYRVRAYKDRKVLEEHVTFPITHEALREIPFGAIMDEARRDYLRVLRQIVQQPEGGTRGNPTWTLSPSFVSLARKRLETAGVEVVAGQRARRVPAKQMENVARVYRAALHAGRNPRQAVAETWQISPSTASNWIARCRGLNLLDPTTRGKPRGKIEEA